MLAFKILFRDVFRLLHLPAGWTFLWLAFRFGNRQRYVQENVRLGKLDLQVPDCLSFIWQYKEIFVEESYNFQTDSPEPVIFDCGANLGMSCLYFRQLFPMSRILAFEADPDIAEILQRNLKKNGAADVQVHSHAVWVDDSEIVFSKEGSDSGSVVSSGENTVRLPAVRLKSLLEKEPRIDLLKMDIEGAETTVLQDCQDSLSHIRNIFVEYHAYLHQPQTLDLILNILQKNGFRYFLRTEQDRKSPFVNRVPKNNSRMDVQINIFAWK
jgi:FkbM family methyltransferase